MMTNQVTKNVCISEESVLKFLQTSNLILLLNFMTFIKKTSNEFISPHERNFHLRTVVSIKYNN